MTTDIQSIQSLDFDEQLLRYAELLQTSNPTTELLSASAVAFSLGKGDIEKRLKLVLHSVMLVIPIKHL